METRWKIGDEIPDPNGTKGRWTVHDIKHGGMGIVYIVYDHKLDDVYAAKTFSENTAFINNPQIVRRFTQEALAWVNVEAHVNVVEALFVQTIERRPYLFLEYVSDGDLSSWIGTPYLTEDLEQILVFAIQFCDGICHAYSKGIKVHRDIKPQNCLVNSYGTLKISDFGLSKVFDTIETEEGKAGRGNNRKETGRALSERLSSKLLYTEADNKHTVSKEPWSPDLTPPGKVLGTPTHMSPEQFRDAQLVDIRADIYAFGVLLFQMITGHLPFVGRTWEEFAWLHTNQSLPRLDTRCSRLEEVVYTCLSKDPLDRFADFEIVRKQLTEIYFELTGQIPPAPPSGRKLDAANLIRKSGNLSELGKYREALLCCDQARSLQPDIETTWYYWYHRGWALGSLEQLEEALACSDRALEIDPKLDIGWLNRGLVLRQLGRVEEAIASYDRALELNPLLLKALNNKAVAFGKLQRHDEALVCLDRILAVEPQNVDAWGNKAIRLVDLGRYEDALPFVDRALELSPHTARHWSTKGRILNMLDRQEEAILCNDRVLDLDPQNAHAWHEKAVILVKLGRDEEAIPCYDRVLDLDPQNVSASNEKAGALIQLRRYEDALASLDHSLELTPNTARAWFAKGSVLEILKRSEEAITYYDHAIALDPHYSEAWASKGLLLETRGQVPEALICYNQALDINPAQTLIPTQTTVWSRKANLLRMSGRIDEALDNYDRALELNPNDIEVLVEKAGALNDAMRFNDTIICCTRAFELNSRHAIAWMEKGVALSGLGHQDVALECFNTSINLDPQLAKAWYNKGVQLGSRGQIEEEISCYSRSLELNAQDKSAWFNKGVALIEGFKNYREALSCFRKAWCLQHPRALRMVLGCLQMLGEEQISWSESSLLKAFEEANLEGESHDIAKAKAHANLGVFYFGRHQYSEAQPHLQKALEINRHLNLPTGIAHQLFFLGAIARSMRKFEEAERMLRTAVSLHRELGTVECLLDVYHQLQYTLAVLGKKTEADELSFAAFEIMHELGLVFGPDILHWENRRIRFWMIPD